MAALRPYLLLFVALTAIYHANLRPIDSSDALPGSLVPIAVALDHTVALDRFGPWLTGHVWYTGAVIRQSHGHYFSSYPIGGPLLVAPFYLPLAPFLRGWDPGTAVIFARIAGKFAATAIAAISAVFLLLLLKRIVSAPWAWCFTLTYALATETWSISSQALWQHGPAELAIIGGLLFLHFWTQRRTAAWTLWACGACTAAAFVIRPNSLVLLPAILAALWLGKAKAGEHLRFVALPLCGAVLLAGYNFYVFHRVTGGYDAALLKGSSFAGLAGSFLSPGRGLLIYTPIALFALFAFSRRASAARARHRALFAASLIFIALDSISIARSVMWWGGYCWGPRMLTELTPPLIVLMAIGLPAIDRPWPRRAFAALALYSLLIQALGVFCYPKGHWDAGPPSVDGAPARLWNWRDNPIARTVRGGPYFEPYAIVGAAFKGGIPAARLRMRELAVDPVEQAEPGELPRADRGLP
jgi:hypothetical protein